MPVFLSQADAYRLIQRELPEGVYPDGPPSGFYSTADSDSSALNIATLYANANRIYQNIWPQTADEFLAQWEFAVFGYYLDATLGLATRRERVIAKLRSQAGIRPADVLAVVQSVIGSRDIIIVENGTVDGSWILEESQLEINTYLGGNYIELAGKQSCLCPANLSCLGLTALQLADLQGDAFTYDVRIYSYSLTAQERTDLDTALNAAERYASFHTISDGLDPADKPSGST